MTNPYLDEIRDRDVSDSLQNYSDEVLATLAVAHELAEANRLTEAIAAPARFVLGNQDPISPEDLKEAMGASKLVAVPDDSGDARIAAAARRWAGAYGSRNLPGRTAATHHLAASELLEAIRQEDER